VYFAIYIQKNSLCIEYLGSRHNLAFHNLAEDMNEITIRKRPRADAAENQRKFFKKTARGKVIKS
jgi:hypothetical protein